VASATGLGEGISEGDGPGDGWLKPGLGDGAAEAAMDGWALGADVVVSGAALGAGAGV
jgi:hypothetical protein